MPRLDSSGRIVRQFAQLWQIPLLLIALAVFALAAYLLLDPQAGMTPQQKIQLAHSYLKGDRPQAAVEQLNRILADKHLPRADQGIARLMLAEAIDASQKQQQINLPSNHRKIIEESQLAISQGAKATGETYQRMATSLTALGQSAQAITRLREAIAIDPAHSVATLRRIIELQLTCADSAAGGTLEEFLTRRDIADSERAWALVNKSQLLLDSGDCFEARSLLREAVRLDTDPEAQGRANLWLARSAVKLGSPSDAEKFVRLARQQLSADHPDGPAAALLLGQVLEKKKEFIAASECFAELLKNTPDAPQAVMALFERAMCAASQKQGELAVVDLRAIPQKAKPDDRELLAALVDAEQNLATQFEVLIEVIQCEQSLAPSAETSLRLATAIQKRVDQVQSPDQRRQLNDRLAQAWLSRAGLLPRGDLKGQHDSLSSAIDAAERSGNLSSAAAGVDTFSTAHPGEAQAGDALLYLAAAQFRAGLTELSAATYRRVVEDFAGTPAMTRSALALAQLSIAKSDDAAAEKLLLRIPPGDSLQKDAGFLLAKVFARTLRFDQAIAQLEQFTKAYPHDERSLECQFLLAECYRNGASSADIRLASAQLADGKAGAIDADAIRKQNLQKAKIKFDEVASRDTSSYLRESDKSLMKLAHLYRADCRYDLGEFAEAIPLYESAAKKLDGDVACVAASVQIVNSYCQLGKIKEAKLANERVKSLLAKLPPGAAAGGTIAMPKAYWEQWVKWTSETKLSSAE